MKNPLEREDFSILLALLFQVCYTVFVSVRLARLRRVKLNTIRNNICAAKAARKGGFCFAGKKG